MRGLILFFAAGVVACGPPESAGATATTGGPATGGCVLTMTTANGPVPSVIWGDHEGCRGASVSTATTVEWGGIVDANAIDLAIFDLAIGQTGKGLSAQLIILYEGDTYITPKGACTTDVDDFRKLADNDLGARYSLSGSGKCDGPAVNQVNVMVTVDIPELTWRADTNL